MNSSMVMQPGSKAERQGVSLDPFLTPLQQQALAGYCRLKAEADRRGWSPARVVSLHCFYWPVTGPTFQTDIRVPAVPLDLEHWNRSPKVKLQSGLEVPYVTHDFTMWLPLQQKYLMGQIDFEEVNESGHIWPLDLANEAVRQNGAGGDRGGVFCYEGTHEPLAKRETLAEEQDKLEQSFAMMITHYRNWFDRTTDAYISRQGTNSWKDLIGKGKYHRWIALYLFRIGSLKELPAWYQEISQPGGKQNPKCDQCKQNVEPDAPICRHCGRVLQPFEAFAKMMIDSETPGARTTAKRLKPAELLILLEAKLLTEENLADWGIEVPGKKKAEPKKA